MLMISHFSVKKSIFILLKLVIIVLYRETRQLASIEIWASAIGNLEPHNLSGLGQWLI